MANHAPKICEVCGKSFLPPYAVTAAYWAGRKYCSHACSHKGSTGKPSKNKGRVHKPLDERFWAKVDKREPDECWEWQGARQISGYGYLHAGAQAGKRWELAHRLAWFLHAGEEPIDDLVVCHRCDNPPCCNPAHLFLGTRADNNRDRVSKGRSHSKLTEVDVREVRHLHAEGVSAVDIAADFGISFQTVHAIVSRNSWAHIR